MARKQNGLGFTAAVVAGAVLVFLVVLVLIATTSAEGTDPAVGFPLVLVVLMVLGSLAAVGWRAVSRRSDSKR